MNRTRLELYTLTCVRVRQRHAKASVRRCAGIIATICTTIAIGSFAANSASFSLPSFNIPDVTRYGARKMAGIKTIIITLKAHVPIAAQLPHGGLFGETAADVGSKSCAGTSDSEMCC